MNLKVYLKGVKTPVKIHIDDLDFNSDNVNSYFSEHNSWVAIRGKDGEGKEVIEVFNSREILHITFSE